MDIETAKRFQKHAEEATRELSSALLLVHDTGSKEEFLIVRKLTGEILARIDGMLHESIYGEHPQLCKLGEPKRGFRNSTGDEQSK